MAISLLVASSVDLSALQTPFRILGTQLGGPLGVVAGVLLIFLALREYRHGHDHGQGRQHGHHHAHGHPHEHGHADPGQPPGHGHDHPHEHDHGQDAEHGAWRKFVAGRLPTARIRSHDRQTSADVDTTGLSGIVRAAFVLGFAYEEKFETIGLCLGSEHCLALMTHTIWPSRPHSWV